MVDCPMSLDPRLDETLCALHRIVELCGTYWRVRAARIAKQCGMEPSDVGNLLARWVPLGVVDHSRHGWRFTKRGLMFMRSEARS